MSSDIPQGNPRHNYVQGEDGRWYNSDGERVYYWVRPFEGDEDYMAGETQGIGQDLGGYYTEAEIKAAYGNTLEEQTGGWDNYWGYISERQSLIEAGELVDPIQGGYYQQAKTGAAANTDPNAVVANTGRADEIYHAQLGANTQLSQQDQMSGWVDQNDGLMEKYGIAGEYTNDNGDVYRFNGSTYVREYLAPNDSLLSQMAPALIMGAFGAGALGPAVAGKLGGGMLGNAAAAGTANAATQLALTGSIDPRSVLSSAVIGGLNPGGALGDNLGLVPDNVTAGFVQGATNSALGDLIATGDVDLQGALLAGGIGAGTNAIKDLFSDSSQFSVESEMERIAAEREFQGLAPLTTEELYQEAMFGNMTGRSDLGGLIGDDGLLPFIPAVKTGGLNNLLGGGYFDPNAVFTGPDGKNYTDVELLQQGIDPSDVFTGGVDGWSYSASSGFWSPVKGDGNGLLSDNGFLDALAEKEFENQYGMTPTDFLAGGGTVDQLKQMIAYGPLDETYNWSDNPRGTSQYVGLLTGLVDGYSTGSLNDQRWFQAGDGGISDALNVTNYQDTAASAPDPNGSVAIINLGDGETVVNPNATLPGSNITVIDAITQGIIDGILVDNSGSAVSGNAGGNTTDVNVNENAVNTDDSLAGNGGNSSTDDVSNTGGKGGNSNENAVNANETLAGNGSTITNENVINNNDDLTKNENAVNTDDELPAGGSGGGNDGGGLFALASGDGLPPIWTDLDPYTTIKRYKSQRTKLLDGMLASLTQQNAVAPTSFVPKSPSEKELFEAGMFS